MGLNSASVIAVVLTLTAGVIGMASTHYLGRDNVVEEVAEEIIDKETGVNIDLSPPVKPA